MFVDFNTGFLIEKHVTIERTAERVIEIKQQIKNKEKKIYISQTNHHQKIIEFSFTPEDIHLGEQKEKNFI